MMDLASWIAAVVGLVGLAVAYLTYRSQRDKTELSYVVTENTKLLPEGLASDVRVSYGGGVVEEPSLSIVRIVNTGDRPLPAADFETDLAVRFDGVHGLASAGWTATRPPDLRPLIEIDGESVRIKPTLINPGDMVQLQVLSAGKPSGVAVVGRVADLTVIQKRGLPYPPGSGEEGQMLPLDRFVWYVITPATIACVGLLIAVVEERSVTARVLILVSAAILAGVLYPLRVRYLVRRRALWRP